MEIKGLRAGYGNKTVVHGVSMALDNGEILVLIGHNGAGKTTTLKSIFGVLKPFGGEIVYKGQHITMRTPAANVKDGLSFIPQERTIFPFHNVRENLEMGGYTVESTSESESRLERVYQLFPVLKQRESQQARTLSGGEQHMLAFGMALMMQPKVLLLDEPSLGLAPILVQRLMQTVREIQQSVATAVILVEQNVKQSLQIADRVYVMRMGRIILEKTGEELLQRGQWWDLF